MSKKNQHLLAINNLLAEFDIETQVKKLTVQCMDSYMRGNKQAFQYIKESQQKLIDFEGRLKKAENYYLKIQTNINSKIQVTNLLNERLATFSETFWQGMKQTTQSVEQMRKNFVNLTREAGTQAYTLKNHENQLASINKNILKVNERIDSQVSEIMQKINKSDENLDAKIAERKKQSEQILSKISQAKSVLQSKSGILTETLKDVNLYKQQKVTINSQINKLYQELNNRVVKAQFYEIRKYIDNTNSIQKQRVNNEFQKIHERVKTQELKREKDDTITNQQLKKTNQYLKGEFEKVKKVAEDNLRVLKQDIKNLDDKCDYISKEKDEMIEMNRQSIKGIQETQGTYHERILELQSDSAHKTNQIQQLQSNIASMNILINGMEKQNFQRAQSLAKLQLNAEEQGDISEQMRRFGQKVMAMDQILRRNTSSIQNNKISSDEFVSYAKKTLTKLISDLQNLSVKEDKQVKQLKQSLQESHTFLNDKIEEKYEDSLNISARNLQQKIDSIKGKLDFLQKVNTEISQFKNEFQRQIEVNEAINRDIKQKMEKMFSMFTRLKSDFFLKLETLNQEHLKSVQKIKQTLKTIDAMSKLFSQITQLLYICLSAGLWKQYTEEKGTFKIASILEGWVLEIDEKQKVKYRGEILSRKMMYQVGLQHFVKFSDKIKGGIIEQGKEVFHRMISSNDDIQQGRKRPSSRGRKSELPKVYR